MTDQARELFARHQIHDVLMRYCRGVDRGDEEVVRSVYHPDSYDDHGYWRGNGHEFATFVVHRLNKANSATTHQVTNVLVELDGAEARCESQVIATLVRRGTPIVVDIMGARYLDRMTEREGEWRIEERMVVLDWQKSETWADMEPPVSLDGFERGGRGSGDPLYRFLRGEVST